MKCIHSHCPIETYRSQETAFGGAQRANADDAIVRVGANASLVCTVANEDVGLATVNLEGGIRDLRPVVKRAPNQIRLQCRCAAVAQAG